MSIYVNTNTSSLRAQSALSKATIKLPTLENQERIYKALKSLSDKIMVEKATLEQYSRQKQYLLRQMFI